MKPREPRRKVLIAARMRAGSAWGDVCVLNVSSRGVLAQAEVPPAKGTYIEVRRGSHVIVARVVWTEKHRFGICSQDLIGVDDFVAGPEGPRSSRPSAQASGHVDSRTTTRRCASGERHEQSRAMGRSLEFCVLVGTSVALASVAFGLLRDAVANPVSKVSAVLALR